MAKKEKSELELIFGKATLVNEKQTEIANLNIDITNLLHKWFDEHKAEIEKDLAENEPVEYFGYWVYNENNDCLILRLTVGEDEDCHHRRIALYPDGHWEYLLY